MSMRSILVSTAAILLVGGCSDRKPPEEADWIIGVYSSQEPGPTSSDALTQYHFDVDTVRIVDMGISGPKSERAHPWETRDENTVAIVDLDDIANQELRVVRQGTCEPFKLERLTQHGDIRDAGYLYAGEVCIRRGDPDIIGGSFEKYWCSEAPEACESGGS